MRNPAVPVTALPHRRPSVPGCQDASHNVHDGHHSRGFRPIMYIMHLGGLMGPLQIRYIICMAVITMVQWKGGVGKSTLAVHFATSFTAILIDLEPWGGATAWWAGKRANELWQAPGPAPVLKALEQGRCPRPRRGEAGRPPLVPSHEQLLSLTSGAATGVAAWAWTSEGIPTRRHSPVGERVGNARHHRHSGRVRPLGRWRHCGG